MMTFIDQHRETFGVESICAELPIAPSTYFRWKAQQREPTRRAPRAQRDEILRSAIRRVWDAHFAVYGVRKVWRQLRREGVQVARCTVQRLMRAMGLAGARRGRAWVTTTQPTVAAEHPRDLVARNFTANRPNQLWVSVDRQRSNIVDERGPGPRSRTGSASLARAPLWRAPW